MRRGPGFISHLTGRKNHQEKLLVKDIPTIGSTKRLTETSMGSAFSLVLYTSFDVITKWQAQEQPRSICRQHTVVASLFGSLVPWLQILRTSTEE